jgi:protein TonB
MIQADVLERRPTREWGLLALAVGLSVAVHIAVAGGASQIPPRERSEIVWMEMAISEVAPPPPPEPPPPPPPPPEPEPKPEPQVVDYVPPTPEPVPVPEVKPVPRAVQGLSNDSFLPGAGTGTARAGNTTTVEATSERMGLDEATEPIPYATVTLAPKARYTPALVVPQEVIDAKLEGTVELLLTIDIEGKVIDIEVVEHLSPAADAACVAAMRNSRWKPGGKDGAPAIVRGVPYACRFQQTAQ